MLSESKRKHLFISHHHKDDESVSSFMKLIAGQGYDVRNSSVRMKPSNQKRMDENRVSDEVIARILRMKISWASTVVVLIGKETHQRKWVNWEIDKANEQGKRIVGVFLRGGTEADIPKSFDDYGSALVNWSSLSIIGALNGENNFRNPDGTDRPRSGSAGSIVC